jgi:5'-3' exoribonuclease 1
MMNTLQHLYAREHKVMAYIRRLRRGTNYDPLTCHAIVGQDADLIMLGLSLHEPKVLILRERVDPPQRSKGAKQKRE